MIAIIGLGVTAALLILVTSSQKVNAFPLALALFGSLAFNAVSIVARWLTKNRRPTFLQGRFPVLLGLAKISGLIACATLVLTLIAGLVAGPPLMKVAFGAFVTGILAFAVLSLVANGLLNFVVVVRHFRGTLVATSREVSGPRKRL